MEIQIPVSIGELIDKLTILEIKADRIKDSKKLENILKEKEFLSEIADRLPSSSKLETLKAELRSINEKLWNVEDRLRDQERSKDFGENFVADARAVYFTNDRRSEIKRQINELLGSSIVEEKSYKAY